MELRGAAAQHPPPGTRLSCSRAVPRDAAFPDCHSEPPPPCTLGHGLRNIKASPPGASVLTSAHSRSWLVLGWGRLRCFQSQQKGAPRLLRAPAQWSPHLFRRRWECVQADNLQACGRHFSVGVSGSWESPWQQRQTPGALRRLCL